MVQKPVQYFYMIRCLADYVAGKAAYVDYQYDNDGDSV